MDQSQLYHYGIKGMRWGIRRTATQLGHTPSGKSNKKPGVIDTFRAKRAKKKEAEREEAEKNLKKNKSVKDMTDKELLEQINRLNMERQVLDLRKQVSALTPQEVSAGKKFVNSVVNDIAAPALKESGKRLLTDTITSAGKKKLGLNDPEDAYKTLKKEVDGLKLKKEKEQLNDYFEARKKKEAKKQEQEKTNSESKTVTGKVVGEGTSKYSPDKGPIIDGDYRDVTPSDVNTGKNYVFGLLEDKRHNK